MVRVRRRRRRRRGTLVLLLHAPSPLLRGGNPLHQHRIFLLPSLLLLLMLFLLVEASHARPAPPVPRPAPRQPPLPRPPQWTVLMGSERPTEGFDPGEERENEVMPPIGMDLPWERTQPSDSSELHQEGPRGEAGVSGGASNSVIEDGNDTLPVPLYGIMTDEISSDVDLMLGGDGGGDEVTSEELVMWRLTNHDRRKGELETDEELLSRNRRTPREKKGGRKEATKKKKKNDEEEEEQKERQRRRKGMRRPRWRERRRKAKEERENRERGGRGGESRRNKKGKESNPRPQRRRHQGHQFSTRERFLEITESVAAKKARRPRGGAVPKKPPVSRSRAKSPRIRGPGSMPRDAISSGEGGVSSGSGMLEDGAARSERSANLSHITGTARKIQMVVKNRNLQIDPWGRVSGAEDEDSDYTILQRTSVSTGRLKIQGVATCLFLCMDRCGLLYGSKNFTEECVWNETMDGHVYNVYTSVAYSNEDRALYLALNGAGKPRRVQIQRKDGKGLVLGKLSTYARVLTRTIQPNRLQRLEDKLLRDRQLEAVAQAVIAAGGTVPGYSNLTAGSLRHRIGPHQPTLIAKTNTGVNPSANRSSDLTSILTSLGLDPSTINPDFNLDSVTFADHPLRHHGYHQLCPMPRPDMVTSGSELVGKNGKVLCKKKDPPSEKGKSGKGSGGGGSGEKKKKKNDKDKDGKMRRKRKNQAKDVEEKRRKNGNNNGRNNGKRGGGGGGGGGGKGGGTKVKKVGEKRVSKGRGNKEKGVEKKAEMNAGRRGRNGEVQKKKKKNNQAAKERERERKREQERRRRVRKRPCNVGKRPRKDKECDKVQRKRNRHRRGKDEMHQEQVLHNNTLEEKNKVLEEEEEEVTEAPMEWEEEEVGEEENERVSEEEDAEESSEGNEDEDGEDEGVDEEDDEEAGQDEEEDDGEEAEGDEDEEDEEDDEDEDDEEDFEEEEDGGENDGRGINVRRKRTPERDIGGAEEDSESS